MNPIPDMVQTFAVVALFADGKTTIRNVWNLRVKETDRLAAFKVSGGLGSLVAEVAAERRLPCRVVRVAVKTPVTGLCGSQSYLYRKYGLSCDALVKTVQQELRGTGR